MTTKFPKTSLFKSICRHYEKELNIQVDFFATYNTTILDVTIGYIYMLFSPLHSVPREFAGH